MRISIGDLRRLIREAGEQLTLPGIDTGRVGSGDEERDLRNELEQLRSQYETAMAARDEYSPQNRPRSRENRDEWLKRHREAMAINQQMRVIQSQLRALKDTRSPEEKELWARYGSDPKKRPWGLGS